MLAAVLWAAPGLAQAQQVSCDDRAAILALLAGKYHEAPSATGVTSAGGLIEVLTSDSGSWTIIVTSPYGRSCMVASGDGWHTFRPAGPDPGPEA